MQTLLEIIEEKYYEQTTSAEYRLSSKEFLAKAKAFENKLSDNLQKEFIRLLDESDKSQLIHNHETVKFVYEFCKQLFLESLR